MSDEAWLSSGNCTNCTLSHSPLAQHSKAWSSTTHGHVHATCEGLPAAPAPGQQLGLIPSMSIEMCATDQPVPMPAERLYPLLLRKT